MPYDPDRHHRRSTRWRGYDYASFGAYFVTICTQGSLCLLGEIVDQNMRLSAAGEMVWPVWDELPERYPGVEVDAFVVMPTHVHGIVALHPAAADQEHGCPQGAPLRGSRAGPVGAGLVPAHDTHGVPAQPDHGVVGLQRAPTNALQASGAPPALGDVVQWSRP